MIGIGRGAIRSMYANPDIYQDFMPVDTAINAMLVSTWNYLTTKSFDRIINLTSSNDIRVTWKYISDLGRDIIYNKYPLNDVMWYPGDVLTRTKWLHTIQVFFFHWLPAYFIDALLILLGIKPM